MHDFPRRFGFDLKTANVSGLAVAICVFLMTFIFPQVLETKVAIDRTSFFGNKSTNAAVSYMTAHNPAEAINQTIGHDHMPTGERPSVNALLDEIAKNDSLFLSYPNTNFADRTFEHDFRNRDHTIVGSLAAQKKASTSISRDKVELYDSTGGMQVFFKEEVTYLTPEKWRKNGIPPHISVNDIAHAVVCLCSPEELGTVTDRLNRVAQAEPKPPIYLPVDNSSRYGHVMSSTDFLHTLVVSKDVLVLLVMCLACVAAFIALCRKQMAALLIEVFNGMPRAVGVARQQLLLFVLVIGPASLGYFLAIALIAEYTEHGLPHAYHAITVLMLIIGQSASGVITWQKLGSKTLPQRLLMEHAQ